MKKRQQKEKEGHEVRRRRGELKEEQEERGEREEKEGERKTAIEKQRGQRKLTLILFFSLFIVEINWTAPPYTDTLQALPVTKPKRARKETKERPFPFQKNKPYTETRKKFVRNDT